MQLEKNYAILDTAVICRQPDRYLGWPTIARLPNGELLVAFSGDRYGHVCPYGKTQTIRSLDNGKTWGNPVTVNDYPLDDRDAGLTVTHSGNLLLSWFTSIAFAEYDLAWHYDPAVCTPLRKKWDRHYNGISPETRDHWLGNWVRLSRDNGNTWEEPVRVPVTSPHGPVCLTDGSLAFIGNEGREKISVWKSFDEGKSWRKSGCVPLPDDKKGKFCEPHMVETSGGKLVAMLRLTPDDENNFLYQTESSDAGANWTPPERINIWGSPAHLLRLKNKDLLLTYSCRKAPFGQYASIGTDNGRKWCKPVRLSSAPNSDHGYPSSVELEDGSIYTVYYEIDKLPEKTCIKATRWQTGKTASPASKLLSHEKVLSTPLFK